jgi:DNA-binding CsgD family transcriptional regulator
MFKKDLSRRQQEAVGYVAQGLTARQIGTKMNCSEQTVKNFLYYARMKLRANNNAHLVYLVYVNEIITSA